MAIDERERSAREAVVRAHVSSENRHDFAATVATFGKPRYEVMPTGESHDGATPVRSFLEETHVAFPDMHLVTHAMHHTDAGVIVEAEFQGTHLGAWRGLPATGRRLSYRMCNVFVFEGDQLVTERLYFDMTGILRQLGIASDPTSLRGRLEIAVTHPLVLAKAFLFPPKKR
jgi:steroid delta-isomerase-like uncharacterized protein